jgi:NTE family protein
VIALALPGGGERVIAWEVGVLAGLADGGVDLRGAPVVGTSAGALVAARLAAGVDPRADAERLAGSPSRAGSGSFDALAAAWEAAGTTTLERRQALGRLAIEYSPGGEDDVVARIADRLPGGGWPPALRVVAIDAQNGERLVLDAAVGVPVERAVAASRAIPTLVPPIRVGDRLAVDGALGSATNADVMARVPAALVLILTPVPPTGGSGPERWWLEALRDEVSVLERAGRRALVVHASAGERQAMGPDPMSRAGAALAVAAGRRRGRSLAAQIRPRRAA